jgi:hypothetical protein
LNKKDLEELLKALNKPRLESWMGYAEVLANVTVGVLILVGLVFLVRGCSGNPKDSGRVHETKHLQAIMEVKPISELHAERYELWRDTEKLRQESSQLQSSIHSKQAELDKLESDIKVAKQRLANQEEFKKELKEEVRQTTTDYLQARDDDIADNARRQGESDGIVTGALLYHFLK